MMNIMKLFLNSLVGVVTTNLSENQHLQELIHNGSKKIQLVLKNACLRFAGIMLIALSISNSYFYLAERIDNNQPFNLGLIGSSGIVLFFLGIIIFYISFKSEITKDANFHTEKIEALTESNTTPPPLLEQALAAFIFDIIKEREEKRIFEMNLARSTNQDEAGTTFQ